MTVVGTVPHGAFRIRRCCPQGSVAGWGRLLRLALGAL